MNTTTTTLTTRPGLPSPCAPWCTDHPEWATTCAGPETTIPGTGHTVARVGDRVTVGDMDLTPGQATALAHVILDTLAGRLGGAR